MVTTRGPLNIPNFFLTQLKCSIVLIMIKQGLEIKSGYNINRYIQNRKGKYGVEKDFLQFLDFCVFC